jgi:hypothetical protein
MATPYRFASYFTNVDLATGLTANLAEIELALQRNPGQFEGIILFDQANGINKPNEEKFKTTIFATGWKGSQTLEEGGFNQQPWDETGIAKIQASNVASEVLQKFYTYADANKKEYVSLLRNNLMRTGSWNDDNNYYNLRTQKAEDPHAFNLGITTEFMLLSEKQTGSPDSVDLFLTKSREQFGDNPHAMFFSNHGGSYLTGSNGDNYYFDNDREYRYLEVYELGESLDKAITYSAKKSRFGLIAYDACLMANIETATQLQDYTRYFLASQETIPGTGFDYFLTLSGFQTGNNLLTQDQIEKTSRELGHSFVNTYNARNGNNNTLSLIDSDAINNLNQAIRQFADAYVKCDDEFIDATIRSIKHKGNKYGNEDTRWLQDLGNVAKIVGETVGAPEEIKKASKLILERLSQSIVANNQNYNPLEGYRDGGLSSGLTITFPTHINQWRGGNSEFLYSPADKFTKKAPKFESATGWSRVIEKVYSLLPILKTNSVYDPNDPNRIDAELIYQQAASARLVLQFNGYLNKTTNDAAINRTVYKLPNVTNATIADLELELDINALNQVGNVEIIVEDANRQRKASWNQAIDNQGVFRLNAKTLPGYLANQTIETGDKVILIPDDTVSAKYDLDLKLLNQSLNYQKEKEIDVSETSLFNFSLNPGHAAFVSLKTPILPPSPAGVTGKFYTDIVLRSSGNSATRLTINDNIDNKLVFTANNFIYKSINLDPHKKYDFTIENINTEANTSTSMTDIAFLIDPDSAPSQILKDSIFTQDISLENWGDIHVNPDIDDSTLLVTMVTAHKISGISDLQEGRSISASVNKLNIDPGTPLINNHNNPHQGIQTFSSGLWTTDTDLIMNIFIEGKGANNAKFGFFKVDELTGAIVTQAGLVAADNNSNYLNAALDKLISPLVDLRGFEKQATVNAPFKAGENYAALLLTENVNGMQTAIFSIPNANLNKAVQFLDFGNGYGGFEDLVQGRDLGYDRDFNDITFYTA